MRRMSLIVATAVVAGVVAAAPAQGQDDPATCLSLIDFTLQPATIVGTPGDDTLRGTEGSDVIVGLGGDDTISGLGGDDVICGDLGDDRIDGGTGSNSILGSWTTIGNLSHMGISNGTGGGNVVEGPMWMQFNGRAEWALWQTRPRSEVVVDSSAG